MSAYTDWTGHMEPVSGTIRFTATEPLTWELGRVGSDLFVTVPALYEHDVSIPRPLRPLFDPHDRRFLKAAALHDELLIAGIDRVTAAGAFNAALAADGVSAARRLAMTGAVAFYRWQ